MSLEDVAGRVLIDIPAFQTLDQPLAHWARQRPEALALADETRGWTFAALHAAVLARAAQLQAARAPLTSWERPEAEGPDEAPAMDVAESLVEFLAIVASGRTAAVADPD
ncbi:MAG: hypothetical protein QM617_08120, partial [Comamonas sp.]